MFCLQKWFQICTFEDLGFISIRKDGTVEISRKNGIPFYMKFNNVPAMYSFVSLLDGYYRLTCKWTFNICKDVQTPSLQKLYTMKCHGPIGFVFKIERKSSYPCTKAIISKKLFLFLFFVCIFEMEFFFV